MNSLGFIGLGVMGEPMALNLRKAGQPLIVWSRTAAHCDRLRDAGAEVAPHPAAVFARAPIVVTMLFDESSTDAVLRRGTSDFTSMVRGRTLVNMSSVGVAYSRDLAGEVAHAGGSFVEAPVSGSRIPAENGELVAMLAGDEALCASIRAVLSPMCRDTIYCGGVGSGMLMKLAINIFMLTTAVGLAEAFHFAERNGLPLDRFADIANASQMASQLSRIKMAKLLARDFVRQGAVVDGVNNTRLITDAARDARVSAALITQCQSLFNEAFAAGHGTQDMIAVVTAIEARSRAIEARDT